MSVTMRRKRVRRTRPLSLHHVHWEAPCELSNHVHQSAANLSYDIRKVTCRYCRRTYRIVKAGYESFYGAVTHRAFLFICLMLLLAQRSPAKFRIAMRMARDLVAQSEAERRAARHLRAV